MKPEIVMLMNADWEEKLFLPGDMERLQRLGVIRRGAVPVMTPTAVREAISGANGCITTWGCCRLEDDILAQAPDLNIVVHAAGSVKPMVSEAIWDRGITVVSGAAAIAVGVAEHALGLMLSAMKRTYWLREAVSSGEWEAAEQRRRIMEPFGISVGVIGAGHVGRHFIKLLQNFDVEVLLYDPLVGSVVARELGAKLCNTPEELISRSEVISLHAPDLPQTRHMINETRLRLMKDGALLINTSRGALIDEAALCRELQTGRISACLDVTDPEPPLPDSPLPKMTEAILTPHVAGCAAQNFARLGRLAADELERCFSGGRLQHQVQRQDLERIA